jgi:serine/threonine-protein kinase
VTEDDPLIGTLVADRYRVGRRLGHGGMGVVYVAVHEALRKQVALKILGTMARMDRDAIARFEREAIATANLKHPNIAETTDFGQLPDGGLYLVMEYVEGTTLRRLLSEQGKLAPERALAILQQVGSALATAHARDVVHRDLKPDNVIVAPAPVGPGGRATDVVKVIDFGLAKLRSATFGGGATGLTSVGTVMGTPTYMSPEQVMGQSVDQRADQYALGVLAFELFTGRPPYKAEDVGQLMMMHVGAPVPSTREQRPELPPEIDTVTTKMLAKLPDERFASVAEAMTAMEAAVSSKGGQGVTQTAVAPRPAGVTVGLAPEPVAPIVDKTTLPSPQRHMGAVPAQASSVRSASTWRAIAIAVGVASVLLGAVVIIFVARSCGTQAPVPPDPAASSEALAQPGAAPATESSAPKAGSAPAATTARTTPAGPHSPQPTAAAAAAAAAATPAAPTTFPQPGNGNGNGNDKGNDKGKGKGRR